MKFELPHWMRSLPVHNGYPVPYFAAIVDDAPDPRVTDPRKSRSCAKNRICWVCGQKLLSTCVFIGGPISTANLTYSDGPMHEECSTFALMVCPYLAVTKRDRRSDDLEGRMAQSEFSSMEKPERFGQLFCKGFVTRPDSGLGLLFLPVKSAVEKVVWWKDGKVMES